MTPLIALLLLQDPTWSEFQTLSQSVNETSVEEVGHLVARLKAAETRAQSPEAHALLAVLRHRTTFITRCPVCTTRPVLTFTGLPIYAGADGSGGDDTPKEHFMCELGGNGINRSLARKEVDILTQYAPWLRRRLTAILKALDEGRLEPPRTPTPPVVAARAAKLIASFSHDDIDVRDRAEQELRYFGDAVIPALLQHLRRTTAPEVRARLQALLGSM